MDETQNINQEELGASWEKEIDEEQNSSERAQNENANLTLNQAEAKRILIQKEIDQIIGYQKQKNKIEPSNGIEKFARAENITYEKLPMLEVVFDLLVKILNTTLRKFTADVVDVRLEYIRSKRLKDYIYEISLPSITGIYKLSKWNNFGLITVTPELVYSIIDVLLGGKKNNNTTRIQGKTYTPIEINIITNVIEIILQDMQKAFTPVAQIEFKLDRIETDPRFADIDKDENAVTEIGIHINIAEKNGRLHIVLPYSTLEPIRDALMQKFMGEKLGKDKIWAKHLASQIWKAEVEIEAVIDEKNITLGKLCKMKKGDTIMLDVNTNDSITIKCGNTKIIEAVTGKIGPKIALEIKKIQNNNDSIS